jgi:WS/DGAT/MGAT family acyltransferase
MIRIRGRTGGRRDQLDRLSDQDVRILKHEARWIRGHTCKVLLIEKPPRRPLPTVQQLRASISARLDAAPRMRQRLAYTPLHVANPVWVDDVEFDIERHVTAVPIERPLGRDDIKKVVADLMTQRLDHRHPLWQLNVVDRLDDGSMALIWRIHHSMGDGITCIRLGSAVLWSESLDPTTPPALPWLPRPVPSGMSLFVSGLANRARAHTHRGKPQARGLGPHSQDEGPQPHNGGLFQGLRSLRGSAAIVGRELGRTAELTDFAKGPGPARAIAFATAPLAESKLAGKAIDRAITLNDVVLALVAGGVREWLCHRHGPTEGIRAKVPVSLHRADEGARVANRDSYFFVDLPIAEPDPVKRLRAINRETRERKLDHDAETLYRLGAHPFVAHWAMSPHVFTFNVSNVPGPQHDIYVLGSRVREMYSVAEIAPRHALRMAVVSAAGSLFFGLCADREVVHDLHLIADGIKRSADQLLAVAG